MGIGKDATIEVVWGRPFLLKKQRVPGWSGFNAVVLSCVPVLTNIGYCPTIDGSPTESHQQGVPSCNAHSS